MGENVSGRDVSFGIAQASTWGTATTLGVGHKVKLNSEGLSSNFDEIMDESAGQPWPTDYDRGLEVVEGSMACDMRYQGQEVLMMGLAMGSAPSPSLVTAGVYSHTLDLLPDLDGLFATFAGDKSVSIHEYPGVKLTGFEIRGEAGQALQITFDAIADTLEIDSSVNTSVSFASVSFPTGGDGHRVLMRQGVFRLNDQSGATLGVSDEIEVSAFTLTCKRPHDRLHTNGTDATLEPAGSGMPDVTLRLEFPNYASDDFITDLQADTAKKASLAFTGAVIANGQSRQFNVYLPHLRTKNATDGLSVSNSNRLTQAVDFAVLGAVTAPSGMTGITEPFSVVIQNSKSTAYVA